MKTVLPSPLGVHGRWDNEQAEHPHGFSYLWAPFSCNKTVQDRKMRIPVQSLTSPQTGKKVVKGSCQFSLPLQPLAHHWAVCKGSVLSKWGAQSPLGPTEPLYLYGRDQRWPGKPAKIYCSRLLWGCVALPPAEGIWRYSSQKSNNFYIVYML